MAGMTLGTAVCVMRTVVPVFTEMASHAFLPPFGKTREVGGGSCGVPERKPCIIPPP